MKTIKREKLTSIEKNTGYESCVFFVQEVDTVENCVFRNCSFREPLKIKEMSKVTFENCNFIHLWVQKVTKTSFKGGYLPTLPKVDVLTSIQFWDGQKGDFTIPPIMSLGRETKTEVSTAYQHWYAKEKNIPLVKEKIIGGESVLFILVPPSVIPWEYYPEEMDIYECRGTQPFTSPSVLETPCWVAETPITIAQWKGEMEECNSGWSRGNLPVVNQTIEEVTEFCNRTGVRLPSYTEWVHYSSCGLLVSEEWNHKEEVINYGGKIRKPLPVKLKGREQKTTWGVWDIFGNVWEMTKIGEERGVKYSRCMGGSYLSHLHTSLLRGFNLVERGRSGDIGFRPVLD